MDNYQTKTMAENELGNPNNPYEYMIKDKITQAQTNMNNIATLFFIIYFRPLTLKIYLNNHVI